MWKYRLLLSPSCSQHSPKHQQQYKKVSSSARVVSIKTLTHYLSWWTSEWEWQGQTMIGLVRKNCKRNPDHLLISDLLPKRQQSSSDVFSAYDTVSVKTKKCQINVILLPVLVNHGKDFTNFIFGIFFVQYPKQFRLKTFVLATISSWDSLLKPGHCEKKLFNINSSRSRDKDS